MNDGIYYEFSNERFATYQDGINQLIKKVHVFGAKLVLMTPPAFDRLPMKKMGSTSLLVRTSIPDSQFANTTTQRSSSLLHAGSPSKRTGLGW